MVLFKVQKFFRKFAQEASLKLDKLDEFLEKTIVNDKIWFQKKYVIGGSITDSWIYNLIPNIII